MSGCCEEKVFDGLSPSYKRALIAVIAINATMFVVEMWAGVTSGSQALKADALDFAGDAATYALSLAVIGAAVRTRAIASLDKERIARADRHCGSRHDSITLCRRLASRSSDYELGRTSRARCKCREHHYSAQVA